MQFFIDKQTDSEIPIPESVFDCILLARSDFYRHYGRVPSLIGMWLETFRNASFQYSFWLRMSKIKGILHYYPKFRLMHLAKKRNIFLLDDTVIGYGLYLGHGFAMVVNESVVIGNNCNLSHFVSIGTNSNNGAHIGDNVYVGPNVSIVEHVVINSDAAIGAGATVCHDVAAHTTVVGVPAKAVSQNGSLKLIQNPWPTSR